MLACSDILGNESIFGNVQTAESTATVNKLNVHLPTQAINWVLGATLTIHLFSH